MNVGDFFDPSFCSRICLTLLHSVWQVALLATVVSIACRLWSGQPRRCYFAGVTALITVFVLMSVTFAVQEPMRGTLASSVNDVAPDKPSMIATAPAIDVNAVGPVEPAELMVELPLDDQGAPIALDPENAVAGMPYASGETESTISGLDTNVLRVWIAWTPWLLCVYVVGVFWMLARLIVSMVRANRFGQDSTLVESGPLFDAMQELAMRWSMKAIPALAVVNDAIMPRVIGVIRPTILLPGSALTGLPQDEWELILAHELAHVRRYDVWVNLLQRISETILFFNPAIWILSRQISLQREYCCDELACESDSQGDTVSRYAVMLLKVAEQLRPDCKADVFASLAADGGSPSQLRRRVSRLLDEPIHEPIRITRGGVAIACVAMLLLAGPIAWESKAETPSSGDQVGKETVQRFAKAMIRSTPMGKDANQQAIVSFESDGRVLFQVIATGQLESSFQYSQPEGEMPNKTREEYAAFLKEIPAAGFPYQMPYAERIKKLRDATSSQQKAIQKLTQRFKSADDPLVALVELMNSAEADQYPVPEGFPDLTITKTIRLLADDRNKLSVELGEQHPTVKALDADFQRMLQSLFRLVADVAKQNPAIAKENRPSQTSQGLDLSRLAIAPLIDERNKFRAQFGDKHPVTMELQRALTEVNTRLCKEVTRRVKAQLQNRGQEFLRIEETACAGLLKASHDRLVAVQKQIRELEGPWFDFQELSARNNLRDKKGALRNIHREMQLLLVGQRSKEFEDLRKSQITFNQIEALARKAKDPAVAWRFIHQVIGENPSSPADPKQAVSDLIDQMRSDIVTQKSLIAAIDQQIAEAKRQAKALVEWEKKDNDFLRKTLWSLTGQLAYSQKGSDKTNRTNVKIHKRLDSLKLELNGKRIDLDAGRVLMMQTDGSIKQ